LTLQTEEHTRTHSTVVNPSLSPYEVTSTKRSIPSNPSAFPAKKKSIWSEEENATIIDLRGRGIKWEEISKWLPGRSAISCRLHYQNYLERRTEWDEKRKNQLALLYERYSSIVNLITELTAFRFKSEMWAKVAEEMAVPWRAVEAMHWQLGEQDIARRAGVIPFSVSKTTSRKTKQLPSYASSSYESFPNSQARAVYLEDERGL
jgi:Myb-like DNA-binding domain